MALPVARQALTPTLTRQRAVLASPRRVGANPPYRTWPRAVSADARNFARARHPRCRAPPWPYLAVLAAVARRLGGCCAPSRRRRTASALARRHGGCAPSWRQALARRFGGCALSWRLRSGSAAQARRAVPAAVVPSWRESPASSGLISGTRVHTLRIAVCTVRC